ncbi:hypothetical protein HPB51_026199 [Rhipicephalus microplus]|uniref:SH3 domain-containing protein n=1 Tax=Rhipicephalus microplus TaxID=6941 RepID=A0A9J6DYM9_RHIMP|nr:hypothetical protein HPB51_026199 [Rhipicephalus microplus]
MNKLVNKQTGPVERHDPLAGSEVTTMAETLPQIPPLEKARRKRTRKNKRRSSEHRKKGRKRSSKYTAPPKVGGSHSQKNSAQNESHVASNAAVADIDAFFGSSTKKDASWATVPNGTSSSLFSRRTAFVRGQLNLFGSTGKGQQKSALAKKGPAPKQPVAGAARSSFRKGAAPAPPVPPHRVPLSGAVGKDNGALLISFDSPPASPTCSVNSGSSGASSAASGGGPGVSNGGAVSLLDEDVPPLQDAPWPGGRGMPHSLTTFWGMSHEGGAGDAAQDDSWNFPRNASLPSLSQEASLPASSDPWNFPEASNGAQYDRSPTEEEWSPPPPMHPPPAPPLEEDSAQQVHDLVALLSEEGADWYRCRCGNEEGLVPKRVWTSTEQHFHSKPSMQMKLTLRPGDKVQVTCKVNDDWWQGRLLGSTSREGIFPAAFVESLS